jgi:hypothetical protein
LTGVSQLAVDPQFNMPPKKGGSKDQRNGGFIFAAFGPTTDKPRAFNIECTSAYLYDQIKEVRGAPFTQS